MDHQGKNYTMNIPQSILDKVGRNLHLNPDHPVGIIGNLVVDYFNSLDRGFVVFKDLPPQTTTHKNFDRLLIPPTHPARSTSDTYYFDENTLLRTHTSAHQTDLLEAGYKSFLAMGDVYRKDAIDRSHYPVFHQIEGVYIFDDPNITAKEIERDLKKVLVGLCAKLFPNCKSRINDDYFPFTNPSFEIEVEYNDKWLEILGCGVVQPEIIKSCSAVNTDLLTENVEPKKAWAFGIGLDRLAMILFDIPDIRLLWVSDPKFTSQFNRGQITKFIPYSVLDPLEKDISFWIPLNQVDYKPEYTDKDEDHYQGYRWLKENDMCDLIRDVANSKYQDIIESVTLFDQYCPVNKEKISRAYRIKYSVPDPQMNNGSEFNDMVNELQKQIAIEIQQKLNVEVR